MGWKEAQRQGEDMVTFMDNSIVQPNFNMKRSLQPNFDIKKEVCILQTNFWHIKKSLHPTTQFFDILFSECSKHETAQDHHLLHLQSMKKIWGPRENVINDINWLCKDYVM